MTAPGKDGVRPSGNGALGVDTAPGAGVPGSGRASMADVQRAIIAEMADLQDPIRKYEHLVGLGRAFRAPGDSIREEAYAVPGCQSQVWIRAELRDGRLRLTADSEALITRGIIALLVRVLDDRTPAEILDGDLFFLDRTGLGSHLSPARSNGLEAMVRRIREYAEEAGRTAA